MEADTTLRDYFLIALLTGARRANVLGMRWADVHLQRGIWSIPETKSGDGLAVPLVPEAIQILKRRRNDEDEWVFPGRGKSGHLVEPKGAWRRLIRRAAVIILEKRDPKRLPKRQPYSDEQWSSIVRWAGLQDLRIHDLRRSLGSWQAATGASLSMIGKTLGHKNVSTTAIYARLNLDPVRGAMETATRAMFNAAKLEDGAEVIPFRSKNGA